MATYPENPNEALDRLIREIIPADQPAPFSMVEIQNDMAKRPRDTNQLAKFIIDTATGQTGGNEKKKLRKPKKRASGRGAAKAK